MDIQQLAAATTPSRRLFAQMTRAGRPSRAFSCPLSLCGAALRHPVARRGVGVRGSDQRSFQNSRRPAGRGTWWTATRPTRRERGRRAGDGAARGRRLAHGDGQRRHLAQRGHLGGVAALDARARRAAGRVHVHLGDGGVRGRVVLAGCGAATSSEMGYDWTVANAGDWGGLMISRDGGLTWAMLDAFPSGELRHGGARRGRRARSSSPRARRSATATTAACGPRATAGSRGTARSRAPCTTSRASRRAASRSRRSPWTSDGDSVMRSASGGLAADWAPFAAGIDWGGGRTPFYATFALGEGVVFVGALTVNPQRLGDTDSGLFSRALADAPPPTAGAAGRRSRRAAPRPRRHAEGSHGAARAPEGRRDAVRRGQRRGARVPREVERRRVGEGAGRRHGRRLVPARRLPALLLDRRRRADRALGRRRARARRARRAGRALALARATSARWSS